MGANDTHLGREAIVRSMIPYLRSLKRIVGGHLGHPLYLKADLKPTPF